MCWCNLALFRSTLGGSNVDIFKLQYVKYQNKYIRNFKYVNMNCIINSLVYRESILYSLCGDKTIFRFLHKTYILLEWPKFMETLILVLCESKVAEFVFLCILVLCARNLIWIIIQPFKDLNYFKNMFLFWKVYFKCISMIFLYFYWKIK